MSAILINKSRTACFSGHRILDKQFNLRAVEEIIDKLIQKGFDTFLVGMALGFDTVCFKILEKVRKVRPIKIIACIPCVKQADRFNQKQKIEYDRMLLSADDRIILSKEYTDRCMQKRNEFMVDNSSVLVCYLRQNRGGTFNTVNYAKKNDVPIIEL